MKPYNISLKILLAMLTLFNVTNSYASGKCAISGSLLVAEQSNSTAIQIKTQVYGKTDFCEEDENSWASWDLAYAIAAVYKGADNYEIENRIHMSDYDGWLNHQVTYNELSVTFSLYLDAYADSPDPNPFTFYCVRGIHGVYNEALDDALEGNETQFCGEFGLYANNPPIDSPIDCGFAVVPFECNNDPLLIDLGRDGIHLGQAGVGVYFDMNADGLATPMQWVRPNGNEAFLVRDINNNGIIDDGSEMFGNGTVEVNALQYKLPITSLYNTSEITTTSNGFEALSQYDLLTNGGDNDGFISKNDAIWFELQLWLDSNADAITTPDELISLEQFGINKLDIDAKFNGRRDGGGNHIPLWSWANTETKGRKFKMVDVFFKGL